MNALAVLLPITITAAVAVSGCGDKQSLLKVGQPAPDVVGDDANGKPVRLSAQRGHPAVVYFYPKDDTPGCTKEACGFRDAFDRYEQRHITIFGVSRDDRSSHRAFREKYHLPFPLVADVDGTVQKAYGVPSKIPGIAARVTFVVGPDGKIEHVFPDVDPGVHANEVMSAAQASVQ